jgi:hypothetical protein
MKHPYPVLNNLRQSETHMLPLSVPLEPCAICHEEIASHEDAEVYQQTHGGPSQVVHRICRNDAFVRIVRAMGRFGPGRLGAALRLDR